MARKRSSLTDNTVYRRAYDVAVIRTYVRPISYPRALTMVEDRRTFHPMGFQRPAASLHAKSRVVARKATHPTWPSARLQFKIPRDIAVCIRRKERREVLLAKGRGGGGHRPPRRNWWSSISC